MTSISRRRLIAAMLAGTTLSSLPAWALGQQFDVIVVGSGASGLTAAIRAAEGGARVLVLEANHWIGGASRVATGIFGCAGHPIQQRLGITTTPEDLYRLYIGTAAATNTQADPEAARILADGAIGAADWLASLGVEWSQKKAQPFFLNIKEGHRLGELMIPALEKRARALGVTLKTAHRVEQLLLADGHLTGVSARTPQGSENFSSRAVILATGGFEANADMISQYIGGGWEKARLYCTPTNRGDGQRMAKAVGATLTDMTVFKANPLVMLAKNGNKYNLVDVVRQGGIVVNQSGLRFLNEAGGYAQSLKIWATPERKAWLLFGEPVVNATPRLHELVRDGSILKADSLPALASLINVPLEALEKTLSTYKSAVDSGKDAAFGRKALSWSFGGAYYAARIEPMMQGTFGGVKTNVHTEVLTQAGKVIPGLFAVGECAAVGLRGVNPQTANIVFGSIAGQRAANFIHQL